MNTVPDPVWRFVRGDMRPREFEQWAYAEDSLQALLDEGLYLELISTDYADTSAVARLRASLERFARSVAPPGCECIALPDIAIIDMFYPGPAMQHFLLIRRRGDPYWWLQLEVCTACGTHWLVAQEERQNDVFLLRRLTTEQAGAILERDEWPPDFDRFETLLHLAREAGHRVRFFDPIGGSSLAWTMQDLARERPGIAVSELARLLNLDAETALAIAREVVATQGAAIHLDIT